MLVGLSVATLLLVSLVALLVIVFEIVMFVHVIKNIFITNQARLFWILGMILVHPIVAIIYYFTDYKKGSSL